MAVTYPLTRNPVKIFAGEASSNTYVTEFKTTESETPAFGNTPAQIQTDAYSQGWINVNNANNVVPYGEDLNAVCLSLSYHIGYLMQDGIPEWDLDTHYTINSFCKVGGTLYKSLVANNIGHDPSVTGNESYWSPMELAPTTASNVGGGAGWYKGKVGADLKFKTLVVEGTAVLEDTDPDILTLRVSSDPSQIVSVPFANVTGAVDSNANLRDALNAKQDLLNYVAENVVNKVTTVAIDPAVASDTLYPSQKAVSTIAANNLTAAKAYADNLLKHSAGARYYPVSSASASSGALSNTVGSTQAEVGWVTLNTTEQLLFTFSMTTASVISTNESNNYDFLLPLSSLSNQRKYSLRAKLTIKDPDEEAVTLFNYNIPTITPSGTNYLLEVKVNNVNRENLSFPIGSEVTLAIYGKVDSNTSDLKLTLNGASNTCALNRNIDLGLNLATFVNTSASGTSQNQEDMNKYLYNAINNKQDALSFTSPFSKTSNTISISKADSSTSGYISNTDWNTFNNKQNAITASSPLSLSNNTLGIAKASSSASGYLSNTDWNTFNNKVSANNSTINIKMNGANKGSFTTNSSSGATIDLGTVITSTSDCAKLASVNTFTDNNIFSGDIYIRKANIFEQDVVLQNYGSRPKFNFTLDGQGYACTATKTAWNFTSDRRLKKNIINIQDGLNIVNELKPVKFDFKNDSSDNSYYSGFIAQDVMEVIPDAVENDGDGYYTLNMTAIIPYLTKSIQQLNAKVESLEARIAELEGNKKELEK